MLAATLPVALLGGLATMGLSPLSEATSALFPWSGEPADTAEDWANDGSQPPAALSALAPSTVVPNVVRPPAAPSAAAAPIIQSVVVRRGDTLDALLARAGVPSQERFQAVQALSEVYEPRRLQVGQRIDLTLAPALGADGAEAERSLVGLELATRFDRNAGITRYPDGGFRPFESKQDLAAVTSAAAATVRTSLFADGLDEGVPAAVMSNFLRLFSFDVDFARDIQPGDAFEVVFERFVNDEGVIVNSGELLFASLTVNGKPRAYYRYVDEDGVPGYFDSEGNGLRKALLRTPVDGARVSSRFGMRRHPIKRYTRMHKGIDFAAPTGTPIRAAGDGTVVHVGRKGGYGRYIMLRHNGTYATAYAHLHRYRKGLQKGERVQQGEVIGYVGSSGVSTGPHLHYEVHKNGQQINPATLKLPSGQRLEGAELASLDEQIATIDEMRRRGIGGNLIAADPDAALPSDGSVLQ